MTYLSRVRINPLRQQSRQLLTNPRAMHSHVCAAVPATPDTERQLWRLDTDNPHRPQLIALTRSKPDWTHLVEAAGWPAADDGKPWVADYTPLLAQLAIGREFAFRLTANPVQNVPRPPERTVQDGTDPRPQDKPRPSVRTGHRTAAHQLNWLLKRTEKYGFQIPAARTDPGLEILPLDNSTAAPDVRILRRDRLSFTKAKRRHVVLHVATFQGRLQVTDTDLLTRALLNGIGPAKAYGCGLLTLAPLAGR
ncbi:MULTISPECIES: type I-E CRISPR-associated protein Cas6/Cse3/CasE [Actinomadura]|uniref:Type I-E CRISPR-associated protein Cas6/Cse3/CasE n=1 Tax=Actinomadura yumaensis TaxID=111807 RepID=A0ABW2CI95_9ACTN|nr:type I-E CRISPR-associated protein Cas6/Cse3/CasE [Actinomadura sp. J1-007]MWK34608.1 type I-E CRISPR-associated protein Cas6/Cse3/CasE [Actinomadura sp. J1-007]